MLKEKKYFKNKWLEFHPRLSNLAIKFGPASYFDNRFTINGSLLPWVGLLLLPIAIIFHLWYLLLLLLIPWGEFYLHLPFYSKIDDCEYPQYGFYWYGESGHNSFWICMGYKKKCIRMPWALEWYRTSALRFDGNWEHELKGQQKDFWQEKWEELLWSKAYPYKYKLNNGDIQIVSATITVRQMEHRPLWFQWTSIFSRERDYIDIQFSGEVGERTGSWKGGTVGCSWNLLTTDETPYDALKRMEKERKF